MTGTYTDAERLDFLIGHSAFVAHKEIKVERQHGMTLQQVYSVLSSHGYRLNGCQSWYSSPQAAIDAAIRRSNRQATSTTQPPNEL